MFGAGQIDGVGSFREGFQVRGPDGVLVQLETEQGLLSHQIELGTDSLGKGGEFRHDV